MNLHQAMREARKRSKQGAMFMWAVVKVDNRHLVLPYHWFESLPDYTICSYWSGNIELKPNKKP